jgi:hypothetical protein
LARIVWNSSVSTTKITTNIDKTKGKIIQQQQHPLCQNQPEDRHKNIQKQKVRQSKEAQDQLRKKKAKTSVFQYP